jgi:ABC-type antimicrobial peptide transport system permease subunit
MYVPASQLTDGLNARIVRGSMAWVVRTGVEPHSLDAAIQNELRQASDGVPVARVRSMEEVAGQSTARSDFNVSLLTTFGLSALMLAAIGVYGLIAHSVEVRTREIGIRLALGAASHAMRNMVVVQAMRLAVAGVAIGVASSLGLTRLISGFLFGVKPLGPVVFVAVPIVLGAVAFVAAWFPARRASRIDPSRALRAD